MGKAKSYEKIEYTKKIMRELCTNQEIIKLLGEEKTTHPEKTIPYHKCYPHEYIPTVVKETDRFINFDMRMDLDKRNRVLSKVTIWVWVVCHEDVVPYFEDGVNYLWYDKVVCEVNEMLTDKNLLGIGKTWMLSDQPYYPQQKFKGRLLTFEVSDFTNGLKYGK